METGSADFWVEHRSHKLNFTTLTRTHTHSHAHTLTVPQQTSSLWFTCTQAGRQAHICTCMNTHTLTHTHTHTHMHVNAHTSTHAFELKTHTHAFTYTDTQIHITHLRGYYCTPNKHILTVYNRPGEWIPDVWDCFNSSVFKLRKGAPFSLLVWCWWFIHDFMIKFFLFHWFIPTNLQFIFFIAFYS